MSLWPRSSRVGDLSGGERRRLQFVRLLMDEPNVLLLDEPTNDLDIETLTSMEDVLDGWAGTLIVVSHDRYLLERMTDRHVALLGDGTLRDLPGGVEEYLRRRADMRSRGGVGLPAASGVAGKGLSEASASARTSTAASGGAGAAPVFSAAQSREARKTLARVERALDRLHEREARLHKRMAAAATDPGALTQLTAELAEVTAEEDSLEAQWLEASDAAEA